MKVFSWETLIYVLVALCLLFSKVAWIDRLPVGLAHDEAIYAVNALSYKERGFDLSGYGLPLSLFRSETEGGITPVAPLIYATISYFAPLTQTSLRLLMVIVHLLTAVVFYKLVKLLTSEKAIAQISLVLFLINPWSTFFSRWAVDTPWSLLFYLLGIHTLLIAKSKLGYLGSMALFILGFFSYHGAKLVFLPVVIIFSLYKYSQSSSLFENRSLKLFIISGCLVFVSYLILDSTLPGGSFAGRSRDIVITRTNYIEDQVNNGRKNSLENDFTSYFINKPVILANIVFDKYVTAFDTHTLFVSGDTRATYRFEFHGLFYAVEIITIVFGFIYLSRKQRRLCKYLFTLIVFAPLATGLGATDTSVINRSFMLLPLLLVVSSYGIYYAANLLKKINPFFVYIIPLVLILSYINFLHFYLFRFPITHQENYFLSDKVLSQYSSLSNEEVKITIVNTTPRATFLEGVIYTSSSENLFNNLGARKLDERDYTINDRITYTSTCPSDYNENETYIVSRESNCSVPKHTAEIVNQKDAGEIYKIVNDTLCESVDLEVYRRFHRIEEYKITDLSSEEFCRIWINSPKH